MKFRCEILRLCILLYLKYEGIGRINKGRKEKGKARVWIPPPMDAHVVDSEKSASKYLIELDRRKLQSKIS